ncbi:papilin-like isoform X2 [Ornithodoros turicata]|uniref:papilin-like isoform X2 n=1 Tax=Ornithodoros turicata TaxID=34597 RepID=UPI00313A334B
MCHTQPCYDARAVGCKPLFLGLVALTTKTKERFLCRRFPMAERTISTQVVNTNHSSETICSRPDGPSRNTVTVSIMTTSSLLLLGLIVFLIYSGKTLRANEFTIQPANYTAFYDAYGHYQRDGSLDRGREVLTGPCEDLNEQRYSSYFDYDTSVCSAFLGDLRYCLMGDNRFHTRDDCRRACINPGFQKNRCKEMRTGYCTGPYDKVYNVIFNGRCRVSKSMLCLQGNNRFLNIEECERFCCASCNSEYCLAPVIEGRCLTSDLQYRFYYDNATRQCLNHRGICLKGRNRYRSLESCASHFPIKSESRIRCA